MVTIDSRIGRRILRAIRFGAPIIMGSRAGRALALSHQLHAAAYNYVDARYGYHVSGSLLSMKIRCPSLSFDRISER